VNAAPDNMPDRDEQAALWCLSLAEGELDSADRAAFDKWVADPDNARAFEEAAKVWNATDQAAELPELIHMRSAALESFRHANHRRWTRRVQPRWYWWSSLAAALLVALLTAALLYTPTKAYKTGIGERQVAMLADGSKLSLDADTEVDVRLGRNRRDLTLVRGRGKFDVAKDPLRPFAVTAGDKMVVATGTSFSVELLDKKVHVLLYEGHVAVLDKQNDKPVPQRARTVGGGPADQALSPGRELVASADTVSSGATVHEADLQHSLSWEAGQLSFDDEPLASAVERMNRYSTQKLVLADPRLADTRVDGVFTAGDVNAFVEAVTALNSIRVERSDSEITLRRN